MEYFFAMDTYGMKRILIALSLPVLFAGLFGWAFVNWKREEDALDEDEKLKKLCTKLKHLPNATGATIAWFDGEECQLEKTVCSDYLTKNGIGFCTQRRKLSEGRSEYAQWCNCLEYYPYDDDMTYIWFFKLGWGA